MVSVCRVNTLAFHLQTLNCACHWVDCFFNSHAFILVYCGAQVCSSKLDLLHLLLFFSGWQYRAATCVSLVCQKCVDLCVGLRQCSSHCSALAWLNEDKVELCSIWKNYFFRNLASFIPATKDIFTPESATNIENFQILRYRAGMTLASTKNIAISVVASR